MPNIQTKNQRIRLLFNIQAFTATLQDQITSQNVVFANGADLQLECFFTYGLPSDSPSTVIDFTNIASVTFSLQQTPDPHNSSSLWTFTVPNGSITNTLTYAQWQAGTAGSPNAQIVLPIPNADNSLSMSSNPQTFWLCVFGTTTDAIPMEVPYGFFQLNVFDSGMPVSNPSLPTPLKLGTPLPFLCSDGLTRNVTIQKSASGLWTVDVNQTGTNSAGQSKYSLFCPSSSGGDNLYRDLTLVLIGGVWTLDIGQTGHS